MSNKLINNSLTTHFANFLFKIYIKNGKGILKWDLDGVFGRVALLRVFFGILFKSVLHDELQFSYVHLSQFLRGHFPTQSLRTQSQKHCKTSFTMSSHQTKHNFCKLKIKSHFCTYCVKVVLTIDVEYFKLELTVWLCLSVTLSILFELKINLGVMWFRNAKLDNYFWALFKNSYWAKFLQNFFNLDGKCNSKN